MEITSLDANPLSTNSSSDLLADLPSVNPSLAISRLGIITDQRQADQNAALDIDLGRQVKAEIALSESLSESKFSYTKQKGDCLYIYSIFIVKILMWDVLPRF